MYKFSAYRSDVEIRKDLSLIAQIIRDNKFDILALQEVFSSRAVELLVRHLPGWEYCWDYPRRASAGASEGYAYIWNTKRFQLSAAPIIFQQYKINRNDFQTRLARDPYYARFIPINGPFIEIRLLNCHIMFGKNSAHSEEMPISEVAMRRNELAILAKALYPKIADKRDGKNRQAFTVLMGDYNLNLIMSDSRSASAYIPEDLEVFTVNDGARPRRIATVQSDYTTLRTPPSDDPHKLDNDYWANNFDHFTYDVNSIKARVARVESVGYCKDYVEHRKIVSDHVPIIMDMRIK